MAYTSLDTTTLVSGKPVKNEVMQLIKTNEDDLNSRLADTEAATVTTIPFKFVVTGPGLNEDELLFLRLPFNITVTDVKLVIPKAGSSGGVEIDVQRRTSGGSWSSILSSTITVLSSAGDYTVQGAAGLTITDIDAGLFVRLDQKTTQVGLQDGYQVEIEYTIRV